MGLIPIPESPDYFTICHHCGSGHVVLRNYYGEKRDECYMFCLSCEHRGPDGKDVLEAVQFWRSEGVE